MISDFAKGVQCEKEVSIVHFATQTVSCNIDSQKRTLIKLTSSLTFMNCTSNEAQHLMYSKNSGVSNQNVNGMKNAGATLMIINIAKTS